MQRTLMNILSSDHNLAGANLQGCNPQGRNLLALSFLRDKTVANIRLPSLRQVHHDPYTFGVR